MASLHPRNVFLHLTERLIINFVVLEVVLLLDGEDFLVREEDVFMSVLGVPMEETLCFARRIVFKGGVRICPFEWQCALTV